MPRWATARVIELACVKVHACPALDDRESQLRRALGIPLDAERVLIFGESSHWDTNWLYTSEEYFRDHIDAIFDAVFAALEREPHRVFAIESVFFLKLYWERRPGKQALIRELLQGRRLRLLSASLTTPDTLLPNTEAILRDFLLGQEWLREQGLDVTPHTAYFPDNFGHSPALPSLMQALGIHGVGITRIDGMYFIGSDWKLPSTFPLRGSTAERLQREHQSLDFRWRAQDGAEVLCHWNAFTYFQGDMLAHLGIIRWMGKAFAIPWRSGRHIARRVRGYTRKLERLAKTPYLFCPIGCDFNPPIPDLCALLDRYNRDVYPSTGVYALSAGLDDYLDLVGCHSERLPLLAADPNPYWMGFYASRPEVKQRPMRISRSLLTAERVAAARPKDETFTRHVTRAWSLLSLTNHHDYITGTSPDRVYHAEQRVWMDDAEAAARDAWAAVMRPISVETELLQPLCGIDAQRAESSALFAETGPGAHLEIERDGELVRVRGPHYRFTLSAAKGGCFTELTDGSGVPLLAGLGNDLVAHRDSGGLWRLGHEYGGGTFRPDLRASQKPAVVEVEERDTELRVLIRSELGKREFVREILCRADSPFIRMQVRGTPKARWTVTCRFETNLTSQTLFMDTPGGRIERPREKLYDPTFWPVPSHCVVPESERQLHVCFDTPGALALKRDRALEWIVARNAHKERAFFFLPVLAHPIGGTSPEEQSFHYALAIEPSPHEDARAFDTHRQRLHTAWLPEAERALLAEPSFIDCDDPRVSVSALKHAENGQGIILRLNTRERAGDTVTVSAPNRRIARASLADAREHDLASLLVEESKVRVPLATSIVTVRLVFWE